MNRQIYVHYGATAFDPLKGFPIKNERFWPKPKGGLWASRKNATFGWKDWCELEQFRECDPQNSFEFTLKDESKLVIISTVQQLKRLPNAPCRFGLAYCIDFEKCLRSGIDAIELCWYGDEYKKDANGDLYQELYGWDCDSIVVLNPDAVVPYTKGELIL